MQHRLGWAFVRSFRSCVGTVSFWNVEFVSGTRDRIVNHFQSKDMKASTRTTLLSVILVSLLTFFVTRIRKSAYQEPDANILGSAGRTKAHEVRLKELPEWVQKRLELELGRQWDVNSTHYQIQDHGDYWRVFVVFSLQAGSHVTIRVYRTGRVDLVPGA